MRYFQDENVFQERVSDLGLAEEVPFRYFQSVRSTMDSAAEWLHEGIPAPLSLVLAKEQTQGRGRLGRQWHASEQGLYATFILRAPKQQPAISGFSLFVGVMLLRVLANYSKEQFFLKWPNDIFDAAGKKLAGILVEVRGQGQREILIGIGLNVQGAPQVDASSLDCHCQSLPSVIELCAQLTREFYHAAPLFFAEGFAAFREEYLQAAWKLQEQIAIRGSSPPEQGTFIDVRPDGALLLSTAEGIVAITVGDVCAL